MTDVALEAPRETAFGPWPRGARRLRSSCSRSSSSRRRSGVILSAFKTTRDIALGDLWSLPDTLYLGNFAEVLANPAVKVYFLNTFLVTAPATVASIVLGILAGWVFAKLPFRGSEALFLVIVSGLFFPPQIILIPLFKLFNTARPDRHAVADDHRPHRDGHPDLHAADAELLLRRAQCAPRGGAGRGRQRVAGADPRSRCRSRCRRSRCSRRCSSPGSGTTSSGR